LVFSDSVSFFKKHNNMYNIIGLECPIRISIKQLQHIPWIVVVVIDVVVVVVIIADVVEVLLNCC